MFLKKNNEKYAFFHCARPKIIKNSRWILLPYIPQSPKFVTLSTYTFDQRLFAAIQACTPNMSDSEESNSSVEVFRDNDGPSDELSCSSYPWDEGDNSRDHVQVIQPY